ncbi:hypothetical protein GCM10025780_30420 [Frondihabitans cladoniiphilus]|uniref:Resolvase HTH domain-containing protein n=2 Tax=Frondihabitans cladoniiphilus TaxID=715785 RepID=A0ABP8W9T5_9MICO
MAAELRRRAANGEPKTTRARDFRISRATVYAYLRDNAAELEQVLAALPGDDRPLPSVEKYDALLPSRASDPQPVE